MIVDDEQDILLTHNSMLCEEGHKVETFSNPHEALLRFAHADKYYYDLVILDIRMPSLNGLQLYHRLKAINKDVRIPFLSALEASEEIASIYPELKNGDIIRKPVTKDYFVKKVNALLSWSLYHCHARTGHSSKQGSSVTLPLLQFCLDSLNQILYRSWLSNKAAYA
jgi:DNA-binding response OmpR family regulator